jgi:dTMP kinase
VSRGTFITVEGIDGSGKSTVVDAVDGAHDIWATQEPSDLFTGEALREALVSDTPELTDFFSFLADRQYHIEEQIEPRLNFGFDVICDRYVDSTRAYQGILLNNGDFETLNHKDVFSWIEHVLEPWILEPDHIIMVDISVDTALERTDREEKYETRRLLEDVQTEYEYQMNSPYSESPCRPVHWIDGHQPEPEMRAEAIAVVEEILNDG